MPSPEWTSWANWNLATGGMIDKPPTGAGWTNWAIYQFRQLPVQRLADRVLLGQRAVRRQRPTAGQAKLHDASRLDPAELVAPRPGRVKSCIKTPGYGSYKVEAGGDAR
jgi:hypothetical protein